MTKLTRSAFSGITLHIHNTVIITPIGSLPYSHEKGNWNLNMNLHTNFYCKQNLFEILKIKTFEHFLFWFFYD